ncbi:hypothetical protein JCM8097_009414 [Rhodosporidiobolus ruineniae]
MSSSASSSLTGSSPTRDVGKVDTLKGGAGTAYVTPEVSSEDAKENHGQLRDFSLLSMLGLTFAVLNSWPAMSASSSLVLPSGGPVAVLYGLLLSSVGVFCLAASLAEICHVYPTSGGPYHWSAILAPPKYAKAISYITGWLACAGWTTLTATDGSMPAQLILGAYSLTHPDFEPQTYQTFIIFCAYMALAASINIFLPRYLPQINSFAMFWSLTGGILIIITLLACSGARGNAFQPGSFVFGGWINETGWPDGVAWILGLLQSSFGLVGVDALSHMVEEIPQAHLNIPKAMVLAVVVSCASSFVFLMVLLFVLTDVDKVISSPAGVLLEIFYQSTGSVAGAICLEVFPIVCMLWAANSIMCVSSRMLHAFARDCGLPFSSYFAKLNPKTGVPERAVVFVACCDIVFALIYFGSSATYNAITSSSVVMLQVSYCVPIVLLLTRGRALLHPADAPAPTWTLGPVLGRFANVVALCFTAVTTVLFVFPPALPVSGSSMNYAVAVFGVVLVIALGTWLTTARKQFIGPRDLGKLLELSRARAEVEQAEKEAEGEKA